MDATEDLSLNVPWFLPSVLASEPWETATQLCVYLTKFLRKRHFWWIRWDSFSLFLSYLFLDDWDDCHWDASDWSCFACRVYELWVNCRLSFSCFRWRSKTVRGKNVLKRVTHSLQNKIEMKKQVDWFSQLHLSNGIETCSFNRKSQTEEHTSHLKEVLVTGYFARICPQRQEKECIENYLHQRTKAVHQTLFEREEKEKRDKMLESSDSHSE